VSKKSGSKGKLRINIKADFCHPSALHNNVYSISEVASSAASSYSNPHQIRRIPTLSSREHIWGNLRQTRMIPVDGALAMQLWDELLRGVVL